MGGEPIKANFSSISLFAFATLLLIFSSIKSEAASYPDEISTSVQGSPTNGGAVLDLVAPQTTQVLLDYRTWYEDPQRREQGWHQIQGNPKTQDLEKILTSASADHEFYVASAAKYGSVEKPRASERAVVKGSNILGQGSHGTGEPPVTKLGALWRSALVPGWGQWYRGQPWLGGAYFGANVLCLGGAYVYDKGGDTSYRNYTNSKNKDDALKSYDEALAQDQMLRTIGYVAVSIYAANLVDAFFFTHPSPSRVGFKKIGDTEIGPSCWMNEQGSSGLQWRLEL